MALLKRWAPAAAALVSLAVTSCDRIDNFPFVVSGKGEIKKGSILDDLLGDLSIAGFDHVSFDQTFANQGVGDGDVDSVLVDAFNVQINAPVGANFDFLTSMRFFANADGLPEVEIAELASVPKGVSKLDFDVLDVELKPYAIAPSMTVRAEIVGKRPSEDIALTATVVFDVDVHVPGCN